MTSMTPKTPKTNRRDFLKGAAAAGVGFWVAGRATWADEAKSKSPNEKLNIAWVGIGGKGKGDVHQAGKHGQVVALCDIDDDVLDGAAANYTDAERFNDYREMFAKMGDKIDAVGVSTPDHTHAVIVLAALEAKKHVYCQKPLTHTVWEARVLRDAARRAGVSTQMGNQGTAEDGLRTAAEYIQAGVIGPVKEVHVWTNRPIWPQSPDIRSRPAPQEPPKKVHWDLFLGPAPERPYNGDKQKNDRPTYHPFNWRGWWDFGTGALGDMGCHTANLPFMGLKLGSPTGIEAEHEELNPETYPAWAHVTFDFPARGDMPALKFHWYEGKRDGKLLRPPEQYIETIMKDGKAKELAKSACIVVGENGLLYSPDDYGASWHLYPKDKFGDVKAPPQTLPRNGKGDEGMKIEWLAGARGGPRPMSNFDYAGALTEFILLGNVAMKAGKRVEFDGEHLKITNDPSLNKLLTHDYRKGFEFPQMKA